MLDAQGLRSLFDRAGLSEYSARIPSDLAITSLTDDSRAVTPGSCFVAIRGTTADGHRFIAGAISAGARVVVVQQDALNVEIPEGGLVLRQPDTGGSRGGVPRAACLPVPDTGGQAASGTQGVNSTQVITRSSTDEGTLVLRVGDTREVLARLAAAYYGLDGDASATPRLIGVTGTNGKTTVCFLLRSILQAAGQTPAMLGTVEYDVVASRVAAPLTTPAPMDLCRHLAEAWDAGARTVVMEVSSHALDQRRCDGLRFAAGVFTNLSGDHIDYHESMDAYLRAKCRLFERLGGDAEAVVNADDERWERVVSSTQASVRTFGLKRPADVTASIDRLTSTSSRFVLRGRSYEVAVDCRLIGEHNIMNVLAAAATAESLGVDGERIAEGVEKLEGVPGRLQRVTEDAHPFHVYVDYAHTDAALENVLDVLEPLTAGRLICVFGCGGDRDRSKRPRMAKAVEQRADLAVVTSDNPRTENPQRIIDDVVGGFNGKGECKVMVEPDRRAAIGEALSAAHETDTVLIAGKGHEDYQILGKKKRFFDDQVVARECLESLGIGLT